MAVQASPRLTRWAAISALVAFALLLAVINQDSQERVKGLFTVPHASVLTESAPDGPSPATPSATRGRSGEEATAKAAPSSKVVRQKHQAHRWNSIQQKIADKVKREMVKQKAEQDAAAKKEASADYWKNVKHEIYDEKDKQRRLQGSRELERAMAAEQEADTQDEDYDRVMAEHRQVEERKSEMAQESEVAGEKAFKDLSTRDSGMAHAQLYHVSESHCGSACEVARNIVS